MNGTTAVYARTSKEVNDAYSVSSQIDNCLAYSKAHDLNAVKDYVFGEDFTGTVIERPELNKLKKLIKSHAITDIVINTTDRLARRTSVGETLLDLILDNNIVLHIVQWGTFVTNSASDRMRFSIESTFASYERAQIVERVTRGKTKKAQSGKVICHSHPPYGYTFNEFRDGLEIVPEQAEIVKVIMYRYGVLHENPSVICADLNARGIVPPGTTFAEHLEEIAEKRYRDGRGLINREAYESSMAHAAQMRGSGVWLTSVIHSMFLHTWAYAGDYTFNWDGVAYTVEVPPIITRDVAKAVDKMREIGRHRFERGKNKGKYLMARRLKCLVCGMAYCARPKGSYNFDCYYICQGRTKQAQRKELCKNMAIRNDILDPMAIDFVKALLLHPDLLFEWWKRQQEKDDYANEEIHNKIAYIDDRIAEKTRKLNKTLDRLTDLDKGKEDDQDEIAFYEQQKIDLKKSIAEFREDRERLEGSLVITVVSPEAIKSYAEYGKRYGSELDRPQSLTFWRTLIDDLDITGEIGMDRDGQFIDFVVFNHVGRHVYIDQETRNGEDDGNNGHKDYSFESESRIPYLVNKENGGNKESADRTASQYYATKYGAEYRFRYHIPTDKDQLIPITSLFGADLTKKSEEIGQ